MYWVQLPIEEAVVMVLTFQKQHQLSWIIVAMTVSNGSGNRVLGLGQEWNNKQLLLPWGRAEMMDVVLEAREAMQILIVCNIELVA